MYEYQKLLLRAAECKELACEANDRSIREKLEELAQQFQDLADRARTLETIQAPRKLARTRTKAFRRPAYPSGGIRK